MDEIWKDIIDYIGLYQVSNLGQVKSLPKNGKKNRILKIERCKNGYLRVQLYKNGIGKHLLVHRLVAEAFLDNPNNLPYVNHIDEDKANNKVENLEYCDHVYNDNYGSRNQRISETQMNDKNKSKSILQFDKQGNFIAEYPSIKEAQRQLSLDNRNISKCCKGKHKTCGGFVWRYKNDE